MAAASRPPAKFHNRVLVYTRSFLAREKSQHGDWRSSLIRSGHVAGPGNVGLGSGDCRLKYCVYIKLREERRNNSAYLITEEAAEEQAGRLVEQFSKENPGLEEYVFPDFFYLARCR